MKALACKRQNITIYQQNISCYMRFFNGVHKKFTISSYEVCLKSNGTVRTAQTIFIAEKKALLSMMSQCLMVSKTKFQHSVTTTFFFARFFVKAVCL